MEEAGAVALGDAASRDAAALEPEAAGALALGGPTAPGREVSWPSRRNEASGGGVGVA